MLCPLFWLSYYFNDDGWTHFVTMYAFSWVRWVYIIVFIGLILGFMIWKTSHKTKLPKYDIIFAMAGFILSVVWINILCTYLMNFLNLIELLTPFKKDFLGLTILAWGNSIGDYFSNRSMAKTGLGVMAVTGCFAG